MKKKNIMAVGLAAAMLLAAPGTVTFAEEVIAVENIDCDDYCDEVTAACEEVVYTDTDEMEEGGRSFADGGFEDLEGDFTADLIDDDEEDSALDCEEGFEDEYEDVFEDDIRIEENETEAEDDLFDEDDLIVDEEISLLAAGGSSIDGEVSSVVAGTKKTVQGTINGFLDVIARENADLLPLIGPLKVLVAEMFGLNDSPNPSQVILEKLEEIDAHLDEMENRLKEHMENVVAFDSIGGEFQRVADSISPLECKIGDLRRRYQKGKIDEDELNEKLANLYNMGEYNSLMQALSGATNSYFGKTSYTLDPRSIFGAAYMLQCDKVMFSGEAIDCVTPYLFRQLTIYLKGYTLINTVLDAYETVYGEDATLETREDMFRNTGGFVNGTFNPKNPGVFGLYSDFFNTNRFIFVNNSSNSANQVRLGQDIYAVFGFSETFLGCNGPVGGEGEARARTPEFMSQFPLNDGQVKAIAQYAASKNMTIYDLLVNTVGFRVKVVPTSPLMRYFGMQFLNCTTESVIDTSGKVFNVSYGNRMTLGEILEKGTTYIPTGKQQIAYDYVSGGYGSSLEANYIHGIHVNKVGAADERLQIAYNHDKEWKSQAVNPNMLFFTR